MRIHITHASSLEHRKLTATIKPPIKKRAWISLPFLSRKLTFVCEFIWSLDEFSINEACRVIIMACSTLNIVTIPYL